MARRIRSIKPEILEDKETASLSDTAFRLFIAFITLADDYGNFRAEPGLLRGQIYWASVPSKPFDEAMSELDKLVGFYRSSGQLYGAIKNWSKHQKVDHAGKPAVPSPGNDSELQPFAKLSRDSRETLATDLDMDQDMEMDLDHMRVVENSATPAVHLFSDPAHQPTVAPKVTQKTQRGAESAVANGQPTRQPTRQPGVRKSKNPPVPGYKELLETYWGAFERAYGRKPEMTPRIGKTAKQLLQAHTLADVQLAVTNAFQDAWFVNNTGGELGAIASSFNKYLVAGRPVNVAAPRPERRDSGPPPAPVKGVPMPDEIAKLFGFK